MIVAYRTYRSGNVFLSPLSYYYRIIIVLLSPLSPLSQYFEYQFFLYLPHRDKKFQRTPTSHAFESSKVRIFKISIL